MTKVESLTGFLISGTGFFATGDILPNRCEKCSDNCTKSRKSWLWSVSQCSIRLVTTLYLRHTLQFHAYLCFAKVKLDLGLFSKCCHHRKTE